MFGVDEMPDFRERVTAFCDSTGVPGYLVGVYQAGEPAIVAHGVANVVTGAPMRADTGLLFGSVTKIMTTTLVLDRFGAIIFTAGFRPDYASWIKMVGCFDELGFPIQVVTSAPARRFLACTSSAPTSFERADPPCSPA